MINIIKYSVIVIFLSICNQLFAQNSNLNKVQIDSLRRVYCMDCKTYLKNIKKDSLLSLQPPSANLKPREDFRCEKKFNIPDSLFVSVFPFNADSIIIAVPKDSCGSEIHTLKKMTLEEIGQFAGILYNYDYRKRTELITFHYHFLWTFPVNLIFYNNGNPNYLYLRFEGDGDRLFTHDSFSDEIYWGEYCEERANMLQQFLLDNYNYRIFHIDSCDCKKKIEVLELQQRNDKNED